MHWFYWMYTNFSIGRLQNKSAVLVCTLQVMKLFIVAELPAIVPHSILEIVREMSYEELNVGFSRLIPVHCTHASP